jgi:hypothetical protein
MYDQTPEQKELAVLVAQDVIDTMQSQNGFAVIRNNMYLNITMDHVKFDEWLLIPDSKEQAKKAKGSCEVCALGACFLSLVALKNEYPFKAYDRAFTRGSISHRLREAFSRQQQDMIEAAFELSSCHTVDTVDGSPEQFGTKYHTDRDRLKAIMENIIANQGVFMPQISVPL